VDGWVKPGRDAALVLRPRFASMPMSRSAGAVALAVSPRAGRRDRETAGPEEKAPSWGTGFLSW
jgi:hypothetical protein